MSYHPSLLTRHSFSFGSKKAPTEVLSKYNPDDATKELLIFAYCPRLFPWDNRSQFSLLHPNVSSLAISRRKRERSFEIDNDFSNLSPTKDCSIDSASQEEKTDSFSKIRTHLFFMDSEEKWDYLSKLYNKKMLDPKYSEKRQYYRTEVMLVTNLESIIEYWWEELTQGRSSIDQKTFLFSFMKIYDILVPFYITGPVEKVQAIQSDFRSECKRDLGLSYENFVNIMLELCDNWVNMEPLEEQPSLQVEPTDEEVKKMATRFTDFLRHLFNKVCTPLIQRRSSLVPIGVDRRRDSVQIYQSGRSQSALS